MRYQDIGHLGPRFAKGVAIGAGMLERPGVMVHEILNTRSTRSTPQTFGAVLQISCARPGVRQHDNMAPSDRILIFRVGYEP